MSNIDNENEPVQFNQGPSEPKSAAPVAAPAPAPAQAATSLDSLSAFTAAYDRQLAAITAVKEDDLAVLNIDPHAAVATVLGTLGEIQALREGMAALPGLDKTLIDGLEDYARAAGEANSRYVTATAPGEDIVALNDEAMKMRETFRSDTAALANRGLIDRARLAAFKGLVGYKNVAFDLIDYANLMRDCWAQVQGRTAILPDEVQKAKTLGERLVLAAGQREQGPAVVAETARIRQQALTLLLKAYDETRRAVTFIRWHAEDVDTIAPSLYAGRGGRGKVAAPAATVPGAVATPAPAGAPTPAAPPASLTNGHSVTPPIAPGLPGASPFAA